MVNILKKKSQIDALLAAAGQSGDGSAGQNGVSVSQGAGNVNHVITLKNFTIPLVDAAGVVAHGGLKFFEFDKGQIVISGCVVNLVITKSSAGVVDAWNGDFGIGSVIADATASLSSTEQNIVATTSTPAGTGTGNGAAGAHSTAKGKLTTAVTLDGSVTAVDLFLNVLVDDANQDVTTTPCNMIFNGTISVTYQNNGVA